MESLPTIFMSPASIILITKLNGDHLKVWDTVGHNPYEDSVELLVKC